MMPELHPEKTPRAYREFVAAVHTAGPYMAVQRACAYGAAVTEQILVDGGYIPIVSRIRELEKGDVAQAVAFRTANSEKHRQEVLALNWIRARHDYFEQWQPEDAERRATEEREGARLAQREAVSAMRGQELFNDWLERMRAGFIQQAREQFDLEHPSHLPKPAKPQRNQK